MTTDVSTFRNGGGPAVESPEADEHDEAIGVIAWAEKAAKFGDASPALSPIAVVAVQFVGEAAPWAGSDASLRRARLSKRRDFCRKTAR